MHKNNNNNGNNELLSANDQIYISEMIRDNNIKKQIQSNHHKNKKSNNSVYIWKRVKRSFECN